MKLSKNTNILIIGLGLIGGSYAKALKKGGYKVYAITKNPEDIEYAKANGIIDDGSVKIKQEYFKKANIIVFALTPQIFVDWVKQNGHNILSGTLVTDVTGVKASIINKVQELLPKGVEYIAAHPMAGREVYGVKNSTEKIFEGANYIVVPRTDNTEKAIEECKNLGETLGFKNISLLTASEHDSMIAYLSQLTHCIAVALMCGNDNQNLVHYTGDSFRDLTRIASINEEMWSELFMLNKDKLLDQMDAFEQAFTGIKNSIKNGNTEKLKEYMRLSTKRRKQFNK